MEHVTQKKLDVRLVHPSGLELQIYRVGAGYYVEWIAGSYDSHLAKDRWMAYQRQHVARDQIGYRYKNASAARQCASAWIERDG